MKEKIIHRYTQNGMEVYLHATDFAPVVSLQVVVKAGSIDENDAEGGLAHVLEHMLFKGTKNYPKAGQIASSVEFEGGDINAYTTFDHTNYHITAPCDFALKGTKLLLDVVQNSLIDEAELSKELEVIKEEIKRGEDNPNSVVSKNLFSEFYRESRLARPIIGFENVVQSFTREDVLNFYKKWYVPNNMIFVAAGKFCPDELFEVLESHSAQFFPKTIPQRERNLPSPLNSPSCKISRKDWQEARIQIATPAPSLDDHDMPAWDLFAAILGESESSRLVRSLKEEHQVVTNIDASCFSPKVYRGLLGIGFFTLTQHVPRALELMIDELRRLTEVPPTQEEMNRVLNSLKVNRIYMQESVDGIARIAGFSLQTIAKMNFENQYLERMQSTSAKEIQMIAKKVCSQLSQNEFTISAAFGEQEEANFLQEQQLIEKIQSSLLVGADPLSTQEKFLLKNMISSPLNEDVKQISFALAHGKKLNINFRQSSRLPISSGYIVFKGGLCKEPLGKNGVAGLTAGLICRGTKQQTYRKFTEELEDRASHISAFSGKDLFGLRFDSMSENVLRTIQMLLECLLTPELSKAEFQRLHKETSEVLIAQKDSPSALLARISYPIFYPNHPYSFMGIGSEESLASIRLEDVQDYWKQLFNAEEYFVSLSGDFPLEAVVNLIETEFSSFFHKENFSGLTDKKIPEPPFPASSDDRVTYCSIQREQAHMSLSFRTISLKDKKRTILEIASIILAGQGGRLFLDLRDEKSLAYTVSASHQTSYLAGIFSTYIATAPSKSKEALYGLKKHIELLALEPPSPTELIRAQNSLLGGQSIEAQHLSYQASQLAMGDAYGMGFDHFLRFKERIMSVTPNDITETLNEILKKNPPIFAIVGNESTWYPRSHDSDFLHWNLFQS